MRAAVVQEAGAAACDPLSVRFTETVLERMRGLLGRPPLTEGEVLVLDCNAVHTFGMGYAIDIVFVDRRGVVRKICEAVPPRRMRMCWSARFALELRAGEVRRRRWKPGAVLPFVQAKGRS